MEAAENRWQKGLVCRNLKRRWMKGRGSSQGRLSLRHIEFSHKPASEFAKLLGFAMLIESSIL